MEILCWLIIFAVSWPWWLDMCGDFRLWRIIRRETIALDEELDLL